MFEKFGEFHSAAELNEAAAGFLEEGDRESIFALAQMEIGDYPECLPEGYIKSHNGMEVEVEREEELWKEAYVHAERIENTLKSRTWNAGDLLLLNSLLHETKEMLGNLEKLQIRAQERAAG